MNSIVQEHYPLPEHYTALREQLMGILGDADLGYSPGGENPTLGELCQEMGEVQQAYVESFKTFAQDFSYRHDDPGLATSVERLSAWFQEMDGELKTAVEALPEDHIQNKKIDRGGGFVVPPGVQLHIYREALLIFYGKVSVYLKAAGKPRPQQWQDWIA